MAGIKDVEEVDMVEEEEVQLHIIIVASKDIWPNIVNYLLKSTVIIEKLRTML